jgi:hypothetical protein
MTSISLHIDTNWQAALPQAIFRYNAGVQPDGRDRYDIVEVEESPGSAGQAAR